MFVVIAYDISSDKIRDKCMEILKDYGDRVNLSVFECNLDEKTLTEIKMRINNLIDNKTDSVLYYILCDSCKTKRTFYGAANMQNLTNLDDKILKI